MLIVIDVGDQIRSRPPYPQPDNDNLALAVTRPQIAGSNAGGEADEQTPSSDRARAAGRGLRIIGWVGGERFPHRDTAHFDATVNNAQPYR